MKDLLKMLLGFLPWIAFGALAGPPLIRLEIAIVVSFVLTIVTGIGQLRKGYVLTWGTLAFFGLCIIEIVLFKDIWFMKHLGILAPGSLAVITWLSILLGKPFVLQFARENAPIERWYDPALIAACSKMTVVWGCLFICSTLVSFAQSMQLGGPKWLYGTLSIGLTFSGIAYTEWVKWSKKRQRAAAAVAAEA